MIITPAPHATLQELVSAAELLGLEFSLSVVERPEPQVLERKNAPAPKRLRAPGVATVGDTLPELTVKQEQILDMLRGKDEPTRGADILEQLGCSGATLHDHINGLIRDGAVERVGRGFYQIPLNE